MCAHAPGRAPPRCAPATRHQTSTRPPAARAAQLDYSRCSDLSDSVGYWYVEDRKDGWCRVFYSTDSKLPAFVPGMLKDMLTNLAAKRSTSWVEMRCNELTGYEPSAADGAVVAKKRRPAWLKRLALLMLAAGAWQLKTQLA